MTQGLAGYIANRVSLRISAATNYVLHYIPNLWFIVPGSNDVTPKFVEVLEKKAASFQCKSNAKPPFPSKLFVWIKNNKDVVKTTDRIVISPDNGTLTFKSLEANDNGTYACSVSMVSSSNDRMDFKDECNLKVLSKCFSI